MDIICSDEDLRKLCEQEREANRRLGAACAKKLRSRIAELLVAETVGELSNGNPHPLTGDRAGQFSLSLAKGMRLVFVSAMDETPTTDDGSIDWPKVSKVKVVYIGDYHD